MSKGTNKTETYLARIEGRYNETFRADIDITYNACVGKNGGPYDLHAYGMSFYRAALSIYDREIADPIKDIEDQKLFVDEAVYPLIFLLRHALEALLKNISNQISGSFPHTHNLTKIWNHIRPIIDKYEIELINNIYIDLITTITNDFQEIDPRADAFRYPLARDGNYNLNEWRLINLQHLITHVRPAYEALDEACNRINENGME